MAMTRFYFIVISVSYIFAQVTHGTTHDLPLLTHQHNVNGDSSIIVYNNIPSTNQPSHTGRNILYHRMSLLARGYTRAQGNVWIPTYLTKIIADYLYEPPVSHENRPRIYVRCSRRCLGCFGQNVHIILCCCGVATIFGIMIFSFILCLAYGTCSANNYYQ